MNNNKICPYVNTCKSLYIILYLYMARMKMCTKQSAYYIQTNKKENYVKYYNGGLECG